MWGSTKTCMKIPQRWPWQLVLVLTSKDLSMSEYKRCSGKGLHLIVAHCDTLPTRYHIQPNRLFIIYVCVLSQGGEV